MTKTKDISNVKEVSVDINLSQVFLKEHESLVDFYDPKKKKLTYKLSSTVSEDVVTDLQNFLSNPKVGVEEIVAFNPLVQAINQMQELKDFTYEPELSDELENEVKEKCLLEHLSYDLATKEYIYDFKIEVIQKSSEEDLVKLRYKTDAEIKKALTKQHKNSHQVYKDAKKIVGSFNSSISKAKKEMKEPHIEYNRLVDSFYNALKLLSDNTKNALDTNFDDCLKIEEQIKEAKKAKEQAEANAKIAELSEENKKQMELIKNQQNETHIAQVFNKIKYTAIASKAGFIATNAIRYDLEALQEEMIVVKSLDFESFATPEDIKILSDEKEIELRQYFEENKVSWIKILEREIKLREEKAEAEKIKTTLEVVQKTSPSFMDDDTAPFETKTNIVSPEYDKMSEDDKFSSIIENLESFNSLGVFVAQEVSKITFNDEFYAKKQTIIIEQSLKQINHWNNKLVDWVKDNQEKYLKWKQENNK